MRHAAAVVALVALGGSAAAQEEVELGREIYLDRCAICHGPEGAGDGIVGELFAKKPADLKLLSRNANGAFPFSMVYQAIDGRREIAGHGGDSPMPVWGEYFMQSAIDDPRIDPKVARAFTQGRILALTYYLQTIQVD